MTENYESAIKVGTTVLKQNPNDLRVLNILSAVKDKIGVSRESVEKTAYDVFVNFVCVERVIFLLLAVNSLAESVASNSDEEDILNAENMQININRNDLDSDMNDAKKNKDFIGINTNQYSQKSQSGSAQNLSDRIKKCLLSHIGKEEKQESFVFKEKMYRVIPMKMYKNSN